MLDMRRGFGWLHYQIRRRSKQRNLPECLDSLGPSDIVLDCGANVGKVTAELAKSGSRVYAFEPDRIAFQELIKNVGGLENVRCIEAAVSTTDGETRLYHRPDRQTNELLSTQGSSLESAKENVNQSDYQLVSTVDLAKFIDGLGQRVACVKMDIEGHEAVVLEHLLDTGVLEKIDLVLVETHERKVPGLGDHLARLKPKIAALENTRVDWNWI